jgi:zinc protease
VLAIIADIVQEPSVPEAELAIRRGEVVTSIRQDQDNPAVRATEQLMALLYPGDHPYGRLTKGTVDVVESLTRAMLLDHHAARFAPSEVSIAIVGDVDAAEATAVAERVFGRWRVPSPVAIVVPPVRAAEERRRIVIPMMNKAQADIAYGFTTITRGDPAYYAYWLMNNVLGQYALGGRLGDSIRERQGMAYYVSSSFDANVAEGPLVIRAGVNAANVDRAVASIDAELVRLRAEGVTPKELDESRRFLIGAMPRALETNAAIANFLQTAEFFGLGADYDARLPDLLRAVTLDDVNAAARAAVDPARATVVVAGPYDA